MSQKSDVIVTGGENRLTPIRFANRYKPLHRSALVLGLPVSGRLGYRPLHWDTSAAQIPI